MTTSYTVNAPDGTIYTLEGPDGASDADVLQQAQLAHSSPSIGTTTTGPQLSTGDPMTQELSDARGRASTFLNGFNILGAMDYARLGGANIGAQLAVPGQTGQDYLPADVRARSQDPETMDQAGAEPIKFLQEEPRAQQVQDAVQKGMQNLNSETQLYRANYPNESTAINVAGKAATIPLYMAAAPLAAGSAGEWALGSQLPKYSEMLSPTTGLSALGAKYLATNATAGALNSGIDYAANQFANNQAIDPTQLEKNAEIGAAVQPITGLTFGKLTEHGANVLNPTKTGQLANLTANADQSFYNFDNSLPSNSDIQDAANNYVTADNASSQAYKAAHIDQPFQTMSPEDIDRVKNNPTAYQAYNEQIEKFKDNGAPVLTQETAAPLQDAQNQLSSITQQLNGTRSAAAPLLDAYNQEVSNTVQKFDNPQLRQQYQDLNEAKSLLKDNEALANVVDMPQAGNVIGIGSNAQIQANKVRLGQIAAQNNEPNIQSFLSKGGDITQGIQDIDSKISNTLDQKQSKYLGQQSDLSDQEQDLLNQGVKLTSQLGAAKAQYGITGDVIDPIAQSLPQDVHNGARARLDIIQGGLAQDGMQTGNGNPNSQWGGSTGTQALGDELFQNYAPAFAQSQKQMALARTGREAVTTPFSDSYDKAQLLGTNNPEQTQAWLDDAAARLKLTGQDKQDYINNQIQNRALAQTAAVRAQYPDSVNGFKGANLPDTAIPGLQTATGNTQSLDPLKIGQSNQNQYILGDDTSKIAGSYLNELQGNQAAIQDYMQGVNSQNAPATGLIPGIGKLLKYTAGRELPNAGEIAKFNADYNAPITVPETAAGQTVQVPVSADDQFTQRQAILQDLYQKYLAARANANNAGSTIGRVAPDFFDPAINYGLKKIGGK